MNCSNAHFAHVISLGFFCSVSLELEKYGFREGSLPFDWTITSFAPAMKLLLNHFEDFFNISVYYQSKNNLNYFKNHQYEIEFYHDFTRYHTLESQFNKFKEKYQRRINRLYRFLGDGPCLFLRYVKDLEELHYILNNYSRILGELKSFNAGNEIRFIANEEMQSLCGSSINECFFFVEKDNNDSVAREPFEKSKDLFDYLQSAVQIDEKLKKPI